MTENREALPDRSVRADPLGRGVPTLIYDSHGYADVEAFDRLRAENERLKRENATMRWQMSAADVPCGCKQTCGDDGDIDGPGTCKTLPVVREPLVELTTVRRTPRASDEEGRTPCGCGNSGVFDHTGDECGSDASRETDQPKET